MIVGIMFYQMKWPFLFLSFDFDFAVVSNDREFVEGNTKAMFGA